MDGERERERERERESKGKVNSCYQPDLMMMMMAMRIVILTAKLLKAPFTKTRRLFLATIVEDEQKGPFSITTKSRYRGGRYSIPCIAPLYP